MTLGITDITTTLVANIIGENSNDVGTLRNSSKNNYWGFKSEYVEDKYWGKPRDSVLPVFYSLGDYRGYDHYWRCWAFSSLVNSSGYYEAGTTLLISLINFPSWANADGTEHHFSVEFKRTNDYQHGSGTFMETDRYTTGNTSFSTSFSNTSPPDGGAALVEGSTVYIRLVHLSSEERRWDDDMSSIPATNGNEYIIPITIKNKGWSGDIYPFSISCWGSTLENQVGATIQIGNDNSSDIWVDWRCELASDSNFTLDKTTLNGSFQADGQPTPLGGAVLSSDNEIVTSKIYSTGQTVYYKAYITYASGHNYSSAQLTGSFIMSSAPPM